MKGITNKFQLIIKHPLFIIVDMCVFYCLSQTNQIYKMSRTNQLNNNNKRNRISVWVFLNCLILSYLFVLK